MKMIEFTNTEGCRIAIAVTDIRSVREMRNDTQTIARIHTPGGDFDTFEAYYSIMPRLNTAGCYIQRNSYK